MLFRSSSGSSCRVLWSSPSRPPQPRLSAIFISELGATASLFTPAHTENRGFPRRPAAPCLPGLSSTLPDSRRRGWTRLGLEQFHPSCACLVASVVSNSLQPVDCSSPGSSVHGLLQTRILEWVDRPLEKRSTRTRKTGGWESLYVY